MKVRRYEPWALYTRGRYDRWPLATKLDTFRELGITLAVSMISRTDPELAEAMGPAGYWSRPMADGPVIPEALVTETARDVARWVAEGRGGVLVNCNAGRNRCTLIVALALCELEGWPGARAMEYVRRVRPRALANPAMETFLLEREGQDGERRADPLASGSGNLLDLFGEHRVP
jgi:hypothetical protein